MPKRINYENGYRFPNTYLLYLEDVVSSSKQRMFRVRCVYNGCSKIVKVSRPHATTAHTKSCGCYRKVRISEEKTFKYEPGYLFPGTWLEYKCEAGFKALLSGKRRRLIEFKCLYKNCTKTLITTVNNVVAFVTRSCGCYNKERVFETQSNKFEAGYLFPNTWLSYNKEAKKKIVNGRSRRFVNVNCNFNNCTTNFDVDTSAAVSGGTKSCGCAKTIRQMEIFNKIVQPIRPDALWEFNIYGRRKVDIAIPSLFIAIEYQGQQHYQMMYYDKGDPNHLKKRKAADREKARWLKANGWKLIKIHYKSYKKNPEAWKIKIEDFINQATQSGAANG